MCLICQLNKQMEVGADGYARTAMRTISTGDLIRKDLADFTRSIVARDGVIDVYLHTQGGEVMVDGGGFGGQIIESVSIDQADQDYIKGVVSDLDQRLDLDFRFVINQADSDLAFYYDTEIDFGDSGVTLGVAISNSDASGDSWELFLNTPAFLNDQAYLRYALIHELGHSLGLEHPFDNTDGDAVDGITNPWNSVYPEDTVMAYRNPLTGSWPQAYTNNDWAALSEIWGAETTSESKVYKFDSSITASDIVGQWFGDNFSSVKQSKDVTDVTFLDIHSSSWADRIQINRVVAASYRGDLIQAKQAGAAISSDSNPRVGSVLLGGSNNDIVRGLAGWDVVDGGRGDDLVHGGNGRDIISGGLGRDELHGDFGWNTFRSENDGYSDLIAIKSDQFLSNWVYGKAENNPNGEKADVIEGLDVSDQIKIIGVETGQLSFANATAHGISGVGIYGGGALEALYTGGDLSVAQLKEMTSGDSSSSALGNQVWSYWWEQDAPPLLG